MTTPLATKTDHSASRTFGKSRRPEPLQAAGAEKSVAMRPPSKKSKPNSPEPGQPSVDERTLHMYGVYADAVAGRDLGEFPKHVRLCLPGARPLLAKRLTDDLVAEKPTAAEAMTRVAIALDNGLPLNEVISCFTDAEPGACQVRALSLLLQDGAIRDFNAGKQVDLLSWTQCIEESAFAQEWMTHLGNFLAHGSQNDPELLQRWLSAITSLAVRVQGHPARSDLVLALLNGFDGDRYPDLNAYVSPGALDAEARMKCDRLRAQLTHEAKRLVAELDAAVRKARSALANEDIAQPAGAEQRKRRIREDPQVKELCSGIVDGLAGGALTLKEVIGALEQCATGSETVAALMHVLVVQAKNNDNALYELFRDVLDEAARPDELVLHMAPALLDGGDEIGLAAGLVERLAHEATGALTRLLPILGLIEALCLRVAGFQTLSHLNERVKGMVREAAARLVMEARRGVEVVTNNYFEALKLARTARLTAEQLDQLGDELLDVIEALVSPLHSPMVCAYVLEDLRSSVGLPACDYLVSLLVRALLQRGAAMDVFMGALVNADVPPQANKAHITLARQVALGFADWVPAGHGLDGLIGGWIGKVAVKPDASTIGFEVLQVIFDDLVSLNKWGIDIKSSLVARRNEVEKRWMARKAEPQIIRVIELIAKTRKQMFNTKECSIVEEHDRVVFLKNKEINDAANELVRAVRGSQVSMGGVIEWLSGEETTFDWELLLLKFIDPLFEASAVSLSYGLNNFMDSLFDVDGTSGFFSTVGIVFAVRKESAIDRDRMIGVIRALYIQYKDDKLSRLQSFVLEYHEGTNGEDEKSRELGALLDAIGAKLEGRESNSVPRAGPPSNPRFPSFLIPTTFPPYSVRDDSSEAESESDLEGDADPAGGLPLWYSMEPPQGNANIMIPPSADRVDVSLRSEANVFAKGVAEALNGGRFEDVKRMITSAGLTVLNLAGPGAPTLQRQGLETLGRIISDRSIVLRELVLGKVTRGISNVTGAVAKSKHLEVLNLYSFEGQDPDALGPIKLYKIDNVLEQMVNLYPSQSMSLQRLIVSNATISGHGSEPMLAKLETVAGGRLKVERID